MYLRDIEPRHVVAVLERDIGEGQRLWFDRNETASGPRGRIENIWAWRQAKGAVPKEKANPARWQGNLQFMLPAPSKIQRPERQRAVRIGEAGDLMATIRSREGMTWRCIELIARAVVCSSEARLARWGEIGLDAKTWTIPGERMKAKRQHVVPLSSQALKMLKSLSSTTSRISCFTRMASRCTTNR